MKQKSARLLTRSARLGVTTVALLAVTVALPSPASAIFRDPDCRAGRVVVHSPSPTCWVTPGSVTVRLYQVNSVFGGDYTGYLLDADGHTRFRFSRDRTTRLPAPVRTIIRIVIDPDGT